MSVEQPLAELSRGQLVERLQELERENRALEARLDAMSTRFDRLERFLIGDDRAFGEDQFDTAADVWTRLDEHQELAETALAIAESTRGERRELSKKEIAKRLSRNECVVEAAVKGTQIHGSIDAATVIDMAKPELRLKHRTIFDAWDELVEEWECFSTTDGQPGPHGDVKQLRCNRDELPDRLVRLVKNSLSGTEVTESLNRYLTGTRGV